MRRGVDGFRIDVLYHLVKDASFRDNPANPAFVPGGDPSHSLLPLYTADLPEVQEIVREMRGVVDAFSDARGDRVLIGELYLPLARLMAYYGLDSEGVLQGVQLPFNFQLIGAQWQADVIDRLVRDYEAALPPGAAPNWVLGNHDKPRIASRVGPERARLAAMLLLTLRGTPTLYYGDEIGMTDVDIPPDEVQDPFEKNEPGRGSAAIRSARRCSGAPGRMRGSAMPAPGCGWPATGRHSMSSGSSPMRHRCSRCTAA